jgi:hypothetical protein
MIWQKHKSKEAGSPEVSLRLETVLVAAWWLVVVGACAYGFMLGMGG